MLNLKESAINGTQVEVTFNKDVKSVKPADFTVTDKATGNYAFVTKAEVSSTDSKVAVLTFANPFTDKSTYTVKTDGVVAVGDKVVTNNESEFSYVKAPVASVQFTATTVKTGTNIKDAVKVLDTLGRDITKEVSLDVQSSDASVVDATGLTVTEGVSVVKVLVNGTTVSTANTAITVSNSAVKTFVGFHLAPAVDAPATTDDFKKLTSDKIVTSVNLGDSTKALNLYYLDQYGKSTNAVQGNNAVYTSINPSVLVVKADGSLVPVSTGTAGVKVKVGDVETTIYINVKAAASVSALNLDKTSVNAALNAIASTFKASFVDQYGKDFAVDTQYLSVKSSDETVATASTISTGPQSSVSYTVNALKEGTALFTVTYDDGTNKFVKQVPVTVTKAGTTNGYQVVVDYNNLDVDATNTTATNDATTAQVSVYKVDANGNKLQQVALDGTTLSFADETATNASKSQLLLDDSTDTLTFANGASISKATTATVNVKVGTLTVGTVTFSLNDSTTKVSSLKFDSVALPSLTDTQNIQAALASLVKTYDQYGTEKAGVLTFEYVLANTTNGFDIDTDAVKLANTVDLTKDSTADIVVTKVTNAGSTTNLLSSPVVVKAVVKGDTVAPVAPVVATADITDGVSPATDKLVGGVGSVEGNATVKVYSNAALTTLVGTATDADATGAFTYDLGANAVGAHTFYVVAVDKAGNVSKATTVTFTAAK